MFKDAIYMGTLAVLTQSEPLEFDRILASAPEVYDYCAHMADQLEESKVNRYGRRSGKAKASVKPGDGKTSGNKDDDSSNNGSNVNPRRVKRRVR